MMKGGRLAFDFLQPIELPLPLFSEHLLVYDFISLGYFLVHYLLLCSWKYYKRERLPSPLLF